MQAVPISRSRLLQTMYTSNLRDGLCKSGRRKSEVALVRPPAASIQVLSCEFYLSRRLETSSDLLDNLLYESIE